KVEPAAVELEVQGEIAGVPVRGRVDLLDTDGRLIDIKSASRRPSWVSPDCAFQLATYSQLTPGASGEVRIDALVKTATPQIVQQSYTVSQADLRATQVLFPMVREAMGSGMYCPNRHSLFCSQKYCSFWKPCEQEFGGRVRPA
ncbi:MAG TPA: PD-(D/E)XK nuclease family protein, partial [Bryobacteraceae bacterium]|nr:PD-(D/E)XK nuclease family protein [Bryobacteraceae bacterium]